MSPTQPGRPRDILLVEDDAADALLVQEALRARGAARSIAWVPDGLAALELLRDPAATRPDLIVVDLNMPRMNGRELLAVLKSDAGLKMIPVVVLSTSDAPADVHEAYARHANACARRLATAIEGAPGVSLAYPSEANAVFVQAAPAVLDTLRARGWRFYSFIGGAARFMCGWDADPARVDALAADLCAAAAAQAA